jgi:hypothetical protein
MTVKRSARSSAPFTTKRNFALCLRVANLLAINFGETAPLPWSEVDRFDEYPLQKRSLISILTSTRTIVRSETAPRLASVRVNLGHGALCCSDSQVPEKVNVPAVLGLAKHLGV